MFRELWIYGPNVNDFLLCILFFTGYTLVILTRMLCKIVFKNFLNNLFRVLDLECFEITKVNYDSSERMYGPSFKLPPVFDKVRIKDSYTNIVVSELSEESLWLSGRAPSSKVWDLIFQGNSECFLLIMLVTN